MFGIGGPELSILAIPLAIYVVITFLLPFFVLRIRRESIKTNQLLEQIAASLNGQNSTGADPLIKSCPHCGAKNRSKDYTCISCSKPI